MAVVQKNEQQLKVCERLQAAYEKMKAESNQANFIAMLEALEADLKEDTSAFLPVATTEDVELLQKEGKIKWMALETPKGRMLSFFTSPEQAMKQGAVANVGIGLLAFFQLMMQNKEVAGFIINPFDEQHGFLLDRKNLEIALGRAKGAKVETKPIEMPLVFEAVKRLFGCAVGVPMAVYEFDAEIATLGGPDAVMQPIQARWQKALSSGEYKPASPVDYVKDVVKDSMTTGFVSGALVKKGPEMVRDADPALCIERVPYLKEDLVQNTDEYVIALCETLRAKADLKEESALWTTLAQNAGTVAFGAMCFGFGWGLAKACESEGAAAMQALKDRQTAFLDRMNSKDK